MRTNNAGKTSLISLGPGSSLSSSGTESEPSPLWNSQGDGTLGLRMLV